MKTDPWQPKQEFGLLSIFFFFFFALKYFKQKKNKAPLKTTKAYSH